MELRLSFEEAYGAILAVGTRQVLHAIHGVREADVFEVIHAAHDPEAADRLLNSNTEA